MNPNQRSGRVVLVLCALLLVACQGLQPPNVSPETATALSTSTRVVGHPWKEGQIGIDPAGRAVMFCRTESDQYLAVSTDGHPMYGSQGDRTHTVDYLAGNNPWSSTYRPVAMLGNLWAVSDYVTNGLDYGRFGIAAMSRAIERAGTDKRRHFEVCYASILFSGEGEDVLDNLILAPTSALALGLEKELNDRDIPAERREALHASLDRVRTELNRILSEVRNLRLDRGDIAADVSGYSYGNAVKGAQWLQSGMP